MTRFILALSAAFALVACSPANPPAPPPPPPAPAGFDAAVWAALPPGQAQALRAALMRAQIEIAQRLTAEQAGAAASSHILRATSELYAPAKADYARQRQSLNEAVFLQAAEAASAGANASQMRWYTDQLLRQVEQLEPPDRSWSRPAAVKTLLTELAHRYSQAVQGGFVVNEMRYQDAFGLAIVTQQIIDQSVSMGLAKDPGRGPELEREAEGLVNMFTTASAPKSPADAGEMLAQISRVELAFPGME